MNDQLTTYAELAEVLEHLPLLLRETRRVRGLSLRAAAKEAGVSFSTLNRYEQGEEIILSTAVQLLRWIGKPTPNSARVQP